MSKLVRKPRRAWLLGLTMDDEKLSKAIDSTADVLMLDLEDGVTPSNKVEARNKIADLVKNKAALGKREVFVRVNPYFTAWGYDDIVAVSKLDVDGIVYPMVRSAEEVRQVVRTVEANESKAAVGIILETSQAFMNLNEIAQVRGLSILMHGPGDLSVETGIAIDDERQRFAVSSTQVVLAAKAYGLQPTDGMHMNGWRDPEAVKRYVEAAINQGFEGMTTFYKPHIPIIKAAFLPSPAETEKAKVIVAEFEKGQMEGKPAIVVDGAAITIHQYWKAQNIVASATNV